MSFSFSSINSSDSWIIVTFSKQQVVTSHRKIKTFLFKRAEEQLFNGFLIDFTFFRVTKLARNCPTSGQWHEMMSECAQPQTHVYKLRQTRGEKQTRSLMSLLLSIFRLHKHVGHSLSYHHINIPINLFFHSRFLINL